MATTADISLPAARVDALARRLRGTLLVAGDPGYDDARRVWNARIDRWPALIARCAAVADVMLAVGFARRHGLTVSVRGSAHNVTGSAVLDGGMTLDLRAMNRVSVDPRRRVARAQAGATWRELDRATQEHGLATTGARISTLSSAGVMLGGGYGWLMRKHGLTIDNVRTVELVTADGRLLTASADEHPELFWGLRGGGGGLGVVTACEYALHDVGPLVTCGVAYYDIERCGEILRCYRDVMRAAPDELTILFNVVVAPPAPFVPQSLHGVVVAALAIGHIGSQAEARRDLAALRVLGPPLLESVKLRPYTTLQRLFDAAGAFGNSVYGRSGHLPELTDDVLDAVAAQGPSISSPLSVVMLSPLGGAIARVGEHDTAFGNRQTRFDCAIDSVWAERGDSARHVAWTDSIWSAIRPSTSGVYLNELGDEGEARLREAYVPAAYMRLAALKATYDPGGVFHSRIKP
jgi:FAD/FMN-containing dehydrogenase